MPQTNSPATRLRGGRLLIGTATGEGKAHGRCVRRISARPCACGRSRTAAAAARIVRNGQGAPMSALTRPGRMFVLCQQVLIQAVTVKAPQQANAGRSADAAGCGLHRGSGARRCTPHRHRAVPFCSGRGPDFLATQRPCKMCGRKVNRKTTLLRLDSLYLAKAARVQPWPPFTPRRGSSPVSRRCPAQISSAARSAGSAR